VNPVELGELFGPLLPLDLRDVQKRVAFAAARPGGSQDSSEASVASDATEGTASALGVSL